MTGTVNACPNLRLNLALMRLGIDLDGVVANFTQGWMGFYNQQFGTELAVEDSQRWHDLVHLTHFADIDEFWRWSSDLDGRSVFWHLEPFPGAIDALRSLDEASHEIIIVTTKPDFAVDDTHEWIETHSIPASEIHILEDKWLVACDVYLDDGPHVLPGLVEHRPDSTVCRYVRPWNQPVPGALDVRDFDEFRDVVDRLAYGAQV
jgi:5'(3')-deoxyribonucleotidase